MSRIILSFVLMAGLSACEPTEVGPGAEDRRSSRQEAAPSVAVKLPPAIAASRQYRCKDNSLAYVDFYADGVSASIRTAKDGPAKRLSSAAPGQELTGEGFALKGGKDDAQVMITMPSSGKPLSCRTG